MTAKMRDALQIREALRFGDKSAAREWKCNITAREVMAGRERERQLIAAAEREAKESHMARCCWACERKDARFAELGRKLKRQKAEV